MLRCCKVLIEIMIGKAFYLIFLLWKSIVRYTKMLLLARSKNIHKTKLLSNMPTSLFLIQTSNTIPAPANLYLNALLQAHFYGLEFIVIHRYNLPSLIKEKGKFK